MFKCAVKPKLVVFNQKLVVAELLTGTVDRFITQPINLYINKFNHKHCHVPYSFQLACGEILTVIFF